MHTLGRNELQFQFEDQHGKFEGTGWGIYSDDDHPAGFTILLHPRKENPDDYFAEVIFSIGELRQMLAEAEELAEEQLANCDCANCNCELVTVTPTSSPLATEQELADEFEDRVIFEDEPSPASVKDVEQLLDRGRLVALTTRDYIDLAFARRDLLGS